MARGLFIAGTGTDVGKTFIAGLILKKLRESGASAAYFKAAMSGNARGAGGTLIPGDALRVRTVSGIEQPLETMCSYIYERAVSPHLASRIEGNPVELERVTSDFRCLCEKYDYVTMEGSGGILCPLRHDEIKIQLTDVIRACGLGCLLVADAGLGTINSVGLTAYYMKGEGIPLRGIILNRFQPGNVMHEDNLRMCEAVAGVKAVACVQDGAADLVTGADVLKSLYK
ncbi:MAG: dethiobiotin synthase [Fretibacterium sp.]|nr:dethiobiotin synthase [Fretibacterium sp.]